MPLRKLHSVEVVVRFTVILACIGGFFWLGWEQVDKFLSGKTSLATSWELRDPNVLPNIVLCPHRGFRHKNAGVGLPELADRAKYEELTAKVDFFLGGLSSTGNTAPDPLDNTTEALYTVYNGKCTVLSISSRIYFKGYVYIQISNKEPIDLYIMNPGVTHTSMPESLHADVVKLGLITTDNNNSAVCAMFYGDEIYLLWQHFTETGITMAPIRDHGQVELQQEEYLSLSKSALPCDNSVQHEDYLRCVNSQLLKAIHKAGAKCIPLILSRFLLAESGLPECSGPNKTEAVRVCVVVTQLLSKPGTMACVKSCRTKSYKVQTSHLAYMDRHWSVFLSLASPSAILSEEYLVYDFNGIVSAMGGGLGMFLGLSCIGIMSFFIDAIKKRAIIRFPNVYHA